MDLRGRRGGAAFSLLELLVVIFIIGILAVLAVPLYAKIRARAQRIQCMANLKSLSVAAEQYVQQNGSWPQIALSAQNEEAMQVYARSWITVLKPFNVTEKIWICPTIQDLRGNPDYMQPENARVDYAAMPFDDKPTRPHEWARQPWFVETGDVHGHGNLIIFTDGSISDLKTLVNPAAR
jgi:prepilin-type N-terminal cleavage/methylation domain-containing protein